MHLIWQFKSLSVYWFENSIQKAEALFIWYPLAYVRTTLIPLRPYVKSIKILLVFVPLFTCLPHKNAIFYLKITISIGTTRFIWLFKWNHCHHIFPASLSPADLPKITCRCNLLQIHQANHWVVEPITFLVSWLLFLKNPWWDWPPILITLNAWGDDSCHERVVLCLFFEFKQTKTK